jgi:Tol biopolymer transport system component/DNA-binding winged helix-turn-helix (wHTH) protein
MEQGSISGMRVRFAEFEADLHSHELFKAGRRLRLPHQSFLILSALLERPRDLVTREELRKRLWPKDTFIDYEQALNAAVNRLREALRDSAEQPTFIETLPKRGYRFIGQIEKPPEPAATVTAREPAHPQSLPKSKSRYLWLAVPIVLALVVAGAWMSKRAEPPAPRLVPLTALPAQETSPAISADGNQLAFAWSGERGSDGLDLYVKAINGEKSLRLTEHPANWLAPAWSHDGKQIAFARAAGEHSGVFLISPLGGEERRIVSAPIPENYLSQVSWSRDDKFLLFSSIGPKGTQAVFRLNIESLGAEPLFVEQPCWDAGSAAYSPAGRDIAFVCTTSIALYGIYIGDAAGQSAHKITEVHGYPRGLTWSDDSEHVVFANDSGDGGGLWQVDRAGKLERIPFGEEAAAPAIDVLNRRLAYVRTREHMDIWRVDLRDNPNEKAPERLIASTRTQALPHYSPDGSRIAFQSNRSGSTEIWVADAQGHNPVRVTSFNGPLTGAPAWCSDGKRLAFDSRASGASAIYVVDVDERLPKKVETTVSNLALPVWSSDCNWLIASNGNDKTYVIPVAGGPARAFTEHPTYIVAVNGSRVVFNVKGGQDLTLWQKQFGGIEEHRIAAIPGLSYGSGWTTTNHGIYFVDPHDSSSIALYDFNTEQVHTVVRLPSAPAALGGLGLSVSPDDHYLLYSVADAPESDIMMLTFDEPH